MSLWESLVSAGRSLLVELGLMDAPRARPPAPLPPRSPVRVPGKAMADPARPAARPVPPPPPPPPRRVELSAREETEDLEEIDLDEPETGEARLPAARRPTPVVQDQRPTPISPRRELVLPRMHEDNEVTELEVARFNRTLRELDADDPSSEEEEEAPRPPRGSDPIARGLVPEPPAAHDDDDDDEDFRPTVIESWREFDEERATISEFADADSFDDMDVRLDGAEDDGEFEDLDAELDENDVAETADAPPAPRRPALERVARALPPVLQPEPYIDEIEELRQQRRPTDLAALTAMPTILERVWEPSPVRAPQVDEPSRAIVPEGFEEIDGGDVRDAGEEAATIDEDLFPMDDVRADPDPERAGRLPPILPREPHPVPAPLARPAPVPSSSSFLDFAPPRSFASLAESAPTLVPDDPAELLAELRAELALEQRTVPPQDDELALEDFTSDEAPLPMRYLNSLGLSDREVVQALRTEHFPELEGLEPDSLYELARVEDEIMEHAASLGRVFALLFHGAEAEDPQWLAAIWWSGVLGEKRVREALERVNADPDESILRWLAWLIRPYLPEMIAARGTAEDRLGIIPALTRVERSLARRRALVRTGPPEMDRELGRYPVNPRGLNLRPGFRWLDP